MSAQSIPIPPSVKDLTDRVFGRLTVVGYAGVVRHRTKWFCHCACGGVSTPQGTDLKSGDTESCGFCFQQPPSDHYDNWLRGYLRSQCVVSEAGCWEWTGGRDSDGYGRQKLRGKTRGAHVISYSLFVGVPIDGLCVLHRCDNPPCINPDHLFLGTHGDNSADRVAKGRQARGSSIGNAKLTDQSVSEIRSLYASGRYSQQDVASMFNVTKTSIRLIVKGRTWKHLPIVPLSTSQTPG